MMRFIKKSILIFCRIFSLTFVAILALASAATVPDESGCQSVVGKETYEPNKVNWISIKTSIY